MAARTAGRTPLANPTRSERRLSGRGWGEFFFSSLCFGKTASDHFFQTVHLFFWAIRLSKKLLSQVASYPFGPAGYILTTLSEGGANMRSGDTHKVAHICAGPAARVCTTGY